MHQDSALIPPLCCGGVGKRRYFFTPNIVRTLSVIFISFQVARYFAYVVDGGLHSGTFNISTLIKVLLEDKLNHKGIIVSHSPSFLVIIQFVTNSFS